MADEHEIHELSGEDAAAQAAPHTAKPIAEQGSQSMLEVHAPHASVHSWKDFFIHIITITIGLLIAIGLEQTVEHFHRLRQLQAVRHELAVELKENRQVIQRDRQYLRLIAAALSRNMALLRASQISHKPPAGPFDYSWQFQPPRTGAWEVAKQSGALDLMPHRELRAYAILYGVYDGLMSLAISPLVAQIDAADAIARRSPDGTLLPHDIDELVTATSQAQGELRVAGTFLTFQDRSMETLKPYAVKQ